MTILTIRSVSLTTVCFFRSDFMGQLKLTCGFALIYCIKHVTRWHSANKSNLFTMQGIWVSGLSTKKSWTHLKCKLLQQMKQLPLRIFLHGRSSRTPSLRIFTNVACHFTTGGQHFSTTCSALIYVQYTVILNRVSYMLSPYIHTYILWLNCNKFELL